MFKDFSDDVSAPVENSTTTVLDNLKVPVNYRNEQLWEFVEDNPLENVVADEPLLVINDFKKQLELIKLIPNEGRLEKFEKVIPTAAERDEAGELITVWRVIPEIIPGRGGGLFYEGKRSFVVKGKKIVRIMLNSYESKNSQKPLRPLPSTRMQGSKGGNTVGFDTLNKIMHFEKSPSSEKGKLTEAWKELATFDNFL